MDALRDPRLVGPGLCLTRQNGEHIDLVLPDGQMITVTPYAVTQNRIRLHISAPRDVRVDRREIRLKREAAATQRREEVVPAA